MDKHHIKEFIEHLISCIDSDTGYSFRNRNISMVGGGSTRINLIKPEYLSIDDKDNYRTFSSFNSGNTWQDQAETRLSRTELEKYLISVDIRDLLNGHWI